MFWWTNLKFSLIMERFSMLYQMYMWCDQAKCVICQPLSIFYIFKSFWKKYSLSLKDMKTPCWYHLWFKSYGSWNTKRCIHPCRPILACYSIMHLPTSDSFSLKYYIYDLRHCMVRYQYIFGLILVYGVIANQHIWIVILHTRISLICEQNLSDANVGSTA